MAKEICIGLGISLVVFCIVVGYDITPFILLLALCGALYFVAENRGLVKNVDGKDVDVGQRISFDDIGGQASAIRELREALDFICNYDKIKHLGIRPIKGILLSGPPGTGKTMMARAAACYTGAVFVAASGSEFIEMYAGVGAQRVRKLFKGAREKAKKKGKKNAVIFIDEMDILGGTRGKTTSHLEYDQTLNQLLVEMDGIDMDDRVRVLVIAATNRVDMLDPALLRPGRFDRQVKIDLPDREGRLEILQLHTKNKPLGEDVDLETIAGETFGFSGAHLENLANEAAVLAMREGCNQIFRRHFNEAIDKVIMGDKLSRKPTKEELKRVAVHETGHALVSEWVRPNSVSTLAITPRGGALGYTRQTPRDDSYLYSKNFLEDQIAVMLGGTVAEEIILGNRSTGSGKDIDEAVKTAESIIRSGMSELGVVDVESLPKEIKHKVLTGIMHEQEKRIKEYLEQVKEPLNYMVEYLLKKERISGEEFRKIFQRQVFG